MLEPLLPPGLELDTHGDLGFLAVATVKTRALRPSFLPRAAGRDFFLTGYRIFTRMKTAGGRTLRGLKILRSDTDRSWMVILGNLLTHYGYRKAAVNCRRENGSLRIQVSTPNAEADLDLSADLSRLPGPLPEGSPFASVAAARKFAGPLPHTFDFEPESNSIVVVRGMRTHWKPEPVAVRVRKCTFLDSEPFCRVTPVLANAFYLADVPYRWERGWREPVSMS